LLKLPQARDCLVNFGTHEYKCRDNFRHSLSFLNRLAQRLPVSALVICEELVLLGRLALLAGFGLTLVGCLHGPIPVVADANLVARVPQANVTANVTATVPPVADASPVAAMGLPTVHTDPHAARVAVVDVDGLLLNTDMTGLASVGDNPVSLFRERLDAVAADPKVVAVVVRINSPGGGVTATDIMWHDLQVFKQQTQLPVVACIMDAGAGGAYYLATAADQIIAHPTSVVGGIGVILNLYNLQDTMAQFNIIASPVKAGNKIDLGSPIVKIDDEGRALLQTIANAYHERFRRVVLQTRSSVRGDDPTNFDGRIFTAEQAMQHGLIDTVGYLNDAVDMAAHSAGRQHVAVAFYHRPTDRAQSIYSTTPNVPMNGSLLPFSLPGLDRSRLPSFLYLWQIEPTMEKLGGK
jgi:protease-4